MGGEDFCRVSHLRAELCGPFGRHLYLPRGRARRRILARRILTQSKNYAKFKNFHACRKFDKLKLHSGSNPQ